MSRIGVGGVNAVLDEIGGLWRLVTTAKGSKAMISDCGLIDDVGRVEAIDVDETRIDALETEEGPAPGRSAFELERALLIFDSKLDQGGCARQNKGDPHGEK